MSEWLRTEYAKATEWNLAMLEEMALIKGTSASRIRRQRDICAKMLDVYDTLRDTPLDKYSRANAMLRRMRRGESPRHVLDTAIETMREGWTT